MPLSICAVQTPETVSVDDPRPLSAAVRAIEQRCRCAITYEDPKWEAADVVDISGSLWHKPDIRPRIPKGGPFTFDVPRELSSFTPAQTGAAIAQVLRAWVRADGRFPRRCFTTPRWVSTTRVFISFLSHLRPAGSSSDAGGELKVAVDGEGVQFDTAPRALTARKKSPPVRSKGKGRPKWLIRQSGQCVWR